MGVYSLKHVYQLVFMNYFILCTGIQFNGLNCLFFQYILITIFSFIFILSILISVVLLYACFRSINPLLIYVVVNDTGFVLTTHRQDFRTFLQKNFLFGIALN